MQRYSRIPLNLAASLLLAGMFSACGDRANRDETGRAGRIRVGG